MKVKISNDMVEYDERTHSIICQKIIIGCIEISQEQETQEEVRVKLTEFGRHISIKPEAANVITVKVVKT